MGSQNPVFKTPTGWLTTIGPPARSSGRRCTSGRLRVTRYTLSSNSTADVPFGPPARRLQMLECEFSPTMPSPSGVCVRSRATAAAGAALVAAAATVELAADRRISFEERVKAQAAIEAVAYSHQLGAKPPLEDVITRDLLVAKVRRYLTQSAALERFWNQPVTAEMLEREADRISRRTRMPERLSELYAALGNDPVLIEECVVRPSLVERLTRSFHAEAQEDVTGLSSTDLVLAKDATTMNIEHRIELPYGVPRHDVSLASARIPTVGLAPDSRVREDRDVSWDLVTPRLDTTAVETVANGKGALRFLQSKRTGAGAFADCLPDGSWDPDVFEAVPERRRAHAAVWTGNTMIIWGGTVEGAQTNSGALYDPVVDSWTTMSTVGAPSPRYAFAYAWTGAKLVVWGGISGQRDRDAHGDGAAYDPVTDSWSALSMVNAPSPRMDPLFAWTGRYLAVWGGLSPVDYDEFEWAPGGALYDVDSDQWIPMSTSDRPPPRVSSTMIHANGELILWGGYDYQSVLGDGWRYVLASGSWRPLSEQGAPSPRANHSAIWTGDKMIIWGGQTEYTEFGNGAIYDPATDAWAPMAATSARYVHEAVWTGQKMIVAGGYGTPGGEVYDLRTDMWREAATANEPSERRWASMVWTGREAIIWGGHSHAALDIGSRYNPWSDTWLPTAHTSRYPGLPDHQAHWTGNQLIVWGGADGGRYDPATDAWRAMSPRGAPSHRYGFTTVWTGEEMIVSGGGLLGVPENRIDADFAYNPITDRWRQISGINAPPRCVSPVSVWTGEEMLVWPGDCEEPVLRGGRYNPRSDTWQPMSTIDAPRQSWGHTAIWTGKEMIIWGGSFGHGPINTGSRYDPETDSWHATSLVNAPAPHFWHTTIWTGDEMIVWGGYSWGDESEGGRYNPDTDSWMPTSMLNVPDGRMEHTAVWTGKEMIVWGGGLNGDSQPPEDTNDGARYDPLLDTWTPTTLDGAPQLRRSHSATWVEGTMIVLGGGSVYTPLSSGGAYVTGRTLDDDLDGFSECEGDCNDGNPEQSPAVGEARVNRIDDDCDGYIDELDRDADGYDDPADNCPIDANVEQDDFDEDGIGDVCESAIFLADVDLSGTVDGFDLTAVARAFGARCVDAPYRAVADLDRNCVVDGEDLSLLAAYFGARSHES